MSGGEKKPLGKILLKQRAVSVGQLDQLLAEQKQHPEERLESIAARSGVSEVELLRALSEQHQVPGIDLTQLVVPVSNLQLVPLEVARQYLILPFAVADDQIMLAMADPHDQRVIEEIEFVTGRSVVVYVALHDGLLAAIRDAYAALARGAEYYIGANAPPDYLASLGLSASPASPGASPGPAPGPAPPPVRPPTLRPAPPASRPALPARPAREAEDFSDLFADEEAPQAAPVARGERPISALDTAFESRVAPLPTDPGLPQRTSTPGQKVLVVDDEDDIRRLLRRVLVERGYNVIEAARGNEALQKVREHQPDLIVLDAMLPEIHGLDICRRVKESQKYGHIPILLVSAVYRGWRFAEDLRESYGVQGFLEKPFKIADVVRAVEAALEHQDPAGGRRGDDVISPAANEALEAGIEAYRRGELEPAIAHLRRGIAADPHAFRLHYHLGLLHGRSAQVFEAIDAMERAVELSPKNFAALKNLAVLYQRAGFKHKAVEVWERALGSADDDETRRGIKDHLISLL
jgi:CheY-like chemotaxis protein